MTKKKCSPKNITTNAKPKPLNVNKQEDYSSNGVYCWEDQEQMKTMISFYYEHNYHHKYLNVDSLSIGKEKIVSIVARELKLDRSHYETVKTTTNQTIECLEKNDVYVPMRKPYEVESCQKNSVNSFDMHLLAKFKTKSSYRIAVNVYNTAFRMNNGLNPLGYKSTYNALQRPNSKITKTKKIGQASNNNLIWRQACFNFCSQLLVRFGHQYPFIQQEKMDSMIKNGSFILYGVQKSDKSQ